MFMSFATLLIGRLEQVVHFANRMVMDAPRLQEFFEVLDTVPAVRDRPDAVDPGRLHGLVEFKDVSFSYDGKRAGGRRPHLHGAAGRDRRAGRRDRRRQVDRARAAAPRLRSAIRRDQDRRHGHSRASRSRGCAATSASCSRRCCCSTARSPRTCASASRTRPRRRLRAACERAQVLDVIERQPQGFETNAGERGRLFSGGERQRLSIARALLKDPPILILDEATSALDALTEAKVQAALAEVMKGRTTFVIAHRLATIRNANRILVFEDGRIIESGTFDELMRARRPFRRTRPDPVPGGRYGKDREPSPCRRPSAVIPPQVIRRACGFPFDDMPITDHAHLPITDPARLRRCISPQWPVASPLIRSATVFVLALLVRLINLAFLAGNDPSSRRRTRFAYWKLGAELARPESFWSTLSAETDRMPLYPLLLGGIRHIFGDAPANGGDPAGRHRRRNLRAHRRARRPDLAAGRIDRRHSRRALGRRSSCSAPKS